MLIIRLIMANHISVSYKHQPLISGEVKPYKHTMLFFRCSDLRIASFDCQYVRVFCLLAIFTTCQCFSLHVYQTVFCTSGYLVYNQFYSVSCMRTLLGSIYLFILFRLLTGMLRISLLDTSINYE